jgi:hypothetical protein
MSFEFRFSAIAGSLLEIISTGLLETILVYHCFVKDDTLEFFTVILIGLKKFATLLPKNWLAKTPQALAPRRLGRQSAERERISEIN